MNTPLAYCEDQGDRLLVVNANSAKRNALSPEYYAVVLDAMSLAASESRITSVILHGDGGFFCAGGDLRFLASRRELPRSERLNKIDDLHDVVRAIVTCPKPVIASIAGGAAGAGVSVAFACDLQIAEDDASFTVAYVNAGLVPDGGLTATLSAQLPRSFVMRMALLGEPVSATQLHAAGAITQLVAAGQTLDSAQKLCDKLSSGPSATQGVIKALINGSHATTLAAQLDAERDAMADAMASPEAGEGISAFLQKRAADFKQFRDPVQ